MRRRRLKRGLLVAFEGGEGLGKSTQVARVAERLREEYVGVIETREPGGTAIGQKLREITHHTEEPLSPAAELLLMVADRAQHAYELIQPALREGQIVLTDRYVDSTLAYQGFGRRWPLAKLMELHDIATGGLFPDVTFVFTGEAHRARGDDRFERLDSSFHERVTSGYYLMATTGLGAQRPAAGFRLINANQDLEAVTAEILEHLRPLLAERR